VAALEGEDPAVAFATGRVLAQAQRPDAMALLWPFIENTKLASRARKETARDLGRSKVGAGRLLKRMERGELKAEMKQAVATVLLIHRHPALRQRAEKLFPLASAKNAEPLPKLSDLIAMKGDPVAGREVYLKEGLCAVCHRGQDQGQAVGPDLSEISTKLARPALFEAILYPSAAISHDYEMWAAELVDGRLVGGTLVNQNEKEIQLRNERAIVQTFDRAQAKSFSRLPVSLMPDNLHQLMTTQELVDLVEYMSTLRRKPGTGKKDQ